MRPIATEQNPLQFPLGTLLGTKAHVRLLRILSDEVVGPIGAADAAERAGLTEAGARRALGRLAKTGFVQRVGGGRSQHFALRENDPLSQRLIDLFRCERERYQSLISTLRELLGTLMEVRLAWIDAPPPRLGDPLHLGVVGASRQLTWLGTEIRQRIGNVEAEFDQTIEVHAFSRADAPDLDWRHVTLLAGSPGGEAPRKHGKTTHSEREQRSLRLSEAIARLLARDPSLVKRAADHIDLLLSQDQGAASHDLAEWRTILERYPKERLVDFLVSSTSRAQRLRQSSPFFAVLSPEERDRILEHIESSK
jgi:hypothetical protein